MTIRLKLLAASAHGLGSRRPFVAGAVCAAVFALLTAWSAPAAAAVVSQNCGAPISSTIKSSGNATVAVTSDSFVNLVGGATSVNVPSGQTRCVRIKFYTVGECTLLNPNTNNLYVRFLVDGNVGFAFPASVGFIATARGANAFEWATTLTSGAHAIRMQTAVNTGDSCSIYGWTMAVDVAK